MSDRCSAARRAAIVVVLLGSVTGGAVLKAGAASRAAELAAAPVRSLPDTLAFDVEYSGIGAEGVDQVWRGSIGGPVPGSVTIRMEYAGAPADRQMPIWPVNALLLFSADDLRNSFAAELSGSMNWTTGKMRVTGLVSDGVRRDLPVDQRMRLHRPGLAGSATVLFLPRLAMSRSSMASR